MKTFTLLAITLCVAGLTYARPNAHTNVVFGSGFGGATFSDFEYSVDETHQGAIEGWSGFANSDESIYPIIMESGTKSLSSILVEGDGTVSVTSTVQEAAAFFRVIGE